jgi:4,5-dihydroxyphthalate decarboxylase
MPDAIQTVELVGADYEHTMGLEGVIEGVDITYKAQPVTNIFGRMISERSFEACEFSLSNYILLKDSGAKWLDAIPVFPNRSFRHNTLFVRCDSELVEPLQLRGRKIGVEDYSMTAAVWVRGLLNEQYGVHWRELDWYAQASQKRFPAPNGVRVTAVSLDLETMLLDGQLDAIMSFGPRDERLPVEKRRLRRLIPNVEEVERAYFRNTGIYPINHCVVIRSDLSARIPEIPRVLFHAYVDSKASAYKRRVGATMIPWGKRFWTDILDFFGGDPLPYGLTEANRKVISKLIDYLHEQKLISSRPSVDALFVRDSVAYREH